MYKYILLDLDGTLTDSAKGIINGFLYAFEKMGVVDVDESNYNLFIGPPLKYSFETVCKMSSADAEKAIVFYREYYAKKGIFESTLYNGVEQTLKNMKNAGCTLILCTSKPRIFSTKIIEKYGLKKYFSFISASEFDGTRPEKEDQIAYALEQCGITEKSAVVMVGDRKYDVIGAQKNGIDCIGVTYGFGSEQELKTAGATHLAHCPQDIEKIICL